MSLFVTQQVKHVPKHRQAPRRTARPASRTAARTMLALSSMAVVGTAVAVAGGSLVLGQESSVASATAATASLTSPTGAPEAAATAPAVPQAPAAVAPTPEVAAAPEAAAPEAAAPVADPPTERAVPVSRSDRRGVADPVKAAALSLDDDNLMERTEDSSDEDPRTIASALLADYGFSSDQMDCLDSLWTKESGWSVTADNPSSSAYGIPQALPGSKMSTAGADWATNPVTQIRWGLGYIEDRYGSPCGAWSHSVSNNWY